MGYPPQGTYDKEKLKTDLATSDVVATQKTALGLEVTPT